MAQQWEHRIVNFMLSDVENEKALNKLGSEGWELVAVVEVDDLLKAFMKRPKPVARGEMTLEHKHTD